MSLSEQAKRVATEFNYPPEDVIKGVKAFISQMGGCALGRRHVEVLTIFRRGLAENGDVLKPDTDVRDGGAQWHRESTYILQEGKP